MNQKINKYVKALAAVPASPIFYNQYANDFDENLIRRNNLILYFQQMVKFNPHILLVGEAPGYRGCRLTGVPFTSEFILLNGLEEIGLFGASRGYQKTTESDKLVKEASATIVWQILSTTLTIPLIWNAFCFHPFQTNNHQCHFSSVVM